MTFFLAIRTSWRSVRQGGNAKRKAGANAARVEEIMREDAPTSFVKAFAKAEEEEEDAPEGIR